MKSQSVIKDFLRDMAHKVRQSTAISHYNFIAAIYRWLSLNDTANTIVWMNVDSGPCGLTREAKSVRSIRLSVNDLSMILSASKKGIDRVRRRLEVGEAAIRSGECEELSDRDVATLVGIHKGLQRGVLAKHRLTKSGLIQHSCRYREVRRYVVLDARDFIPYLICLMCQTLANPQSAMEISVDCVEAHPVDPLKRRVTWDKYRAGRQQVLDVSADGRYSVPALVEDITLRTRALRPIAGNFATRLFISPFGSEARTPVAQCWHEALAEFIKEHDLPDFNFVDIRASGAEALSTSGVGIESIQRKMQHSDPRTTQRYLSRHPPSSQARRKVATFIGKVLEEARRPTARRYETVTGLQCSDPASGVAPQSVVGKECLQYLQCATCPNSVVVIDSPKHVSRMLATLSSLERMKKEATESIDVRARYLAAYEATHQVLLALLERVPARVLEVARPLALKIPQLSME
ncbi:site-specific integrase [Stenotrophomonas maltophilia]|uniref:site-specific integrase n=1 Tax=Stenotrophomonas maltophilia TaxID=40324 RepID=UPI0012DB5362|nr:site-specific integrase [Stenotrophomonas maltophilia]